MGPVRVRPFVLPRCDANVADSCNFRREFTQVKKTQQEANKTVPGVDGNLPVATDGSRLDAFRRNEKSKRL